MFTNCQDCGVDAELEEVKREWWNVVVENSWEWKRTQAKKTGDTDDEIHKS